MKNNQRGFSAVEGLLILVIVGLIGFIGWYVWQTKSQTDKSLNTAASTSTNSSASKNTAASTSPSAATQTKYLQITQFGIKIPLTSAIPDLTYQNNGLYSSSSLPTKIHQIASACTTTTTPWNTLDIISNTAPVNGDTDATVTVNGTTYYLFKKGGSAPCPDSPEYTPTAAEQSQIDTAVSTYDSAMDKAFSNAIAL